MAKLERVIHGDFQSILSAMEQGILEGSASATLEETSDFSGASSRCSIRVFERYSCMGGNRVSLSVTLFQEADGPVFLSAITSGGSQAVFFKINTIGEETFLEELEGILDTFSSLMNYDYKK